MPSKFAFDHPDDALRALAEKLSVVGIERNLAVEAAIGRVLAAPVVADRDSPAADVSAMDGYAIRLSQLQSGVDVGVAAESVPGSSPPILPEGEVVRIFTGAIIPAGTEAVIKREHTDESSGQIRFQGAALSATVGENIRRSGENARQGRQVVSAGTCMSAAKLAAAINFSCFNADFFSAVKVSIITTGDEVGVFKNDLPQPWQLQNSNGFALGGLLGPIPWIATMAACHCRDDRSALTDMISKQLETSDAVLMTGGVSMGDYDHVPDVVRDVGGEIVFHGLPLRPGKPILGAATSDGKLIVGLPGNPVSATIGCRRMAMPLIAKMSGQTTWLAPVPAVALDRADAKTLPLHWMRLVRLNAAGAAELVTSQGSGDLVSMAQSDGFVEIPPCDSSDDRSGSGPWPFYAW